MVRQAHHERRIRRLLNLNPFALSLSKGERIPAGYVLCRESPKNFRFGKKLDDNCKFPGQNLVTPPTVIEFCFLYFSSSQHIFAVNRAESAFTQPIKSMRSGVTDNA